MRVEITRRFFSHADSPPGALSGVSLKVLSYVGAAGANAVVTEGGSPPVFICVFRLAGVTVHDACPQGGLGQCCADIVIASRPAGQEPKPCGQHSGQSPGTGSDES